MGNKQFTSVQTDKGFVIYDNLAQRYVSKLRPKPAASDLTADINEAEVWEANTEQLHGMFKSVLKELNKREA